MHHPPEPSVYDTAAACCGGKAISLPEQGSRRRRLWELDGHVHCPVVGACLPISALRRLVDKKLGGQALASDYELHCGTVTECKRRTPIAEALHKELDRRYALALRQTAGIKTTEALADWWHQASAGPDLPGAFWATLSHARCNAPLEYRVLGEVHMLQHQVGTAQRVDQTRLNATLEQNAALQAELAALQQRHRQQVSEQAAQVERLQTELMRSRAEAIGLASALAASRDDLAALECSVPELKSRAELLRQNQHRNERIADLERALAQARQEAENQRRRADHRAAAHEAASNPGDCLPADTDESTQAAPVLNDRSVLCVGGRPASVPLYRHIVERTGGRFLHHDGGEEHSVSRLDATLAAADLVICQTGCISHNAYWRVKDHCKRTGTPCVFVENPGSASLKRALAEFQPVVFPGACPAAAATALPAGLPTVMQAAVPAVHSAS